MKTLLTLLILAAIGYGIYHFPAKPAEILINTTATPTATGIDERDAFVRAPTDAGTSVESVTELESDVPLTPSVTISVTHTAQAPDGNWKDMRLLNASQEASLVMTVHWLYGRPLTSVQALKEIRDADEFIQAAFNGATQLSLDDLARTFRGHAGYADVAVASGNMNEDIKKALAAGSIVIVPVSSKALNNQYYLPTLPDQHAVLVRGYDDSKKQFIVNDPGTRRGDGYRYGYDIFQHALRTYGTGTAGWPSETNTGMLIIHPRT